MKNLTWPCEQSTTHAAFHTLSFSSDGGTLVGAGRLVKQLPAGNTSGPAVLCLWRVPRNFVHGDTAIATVAQNVLGIACAFFRGFELNPT
jgi:hypothetical protein